MGTASDEYLRETYGGLFEEATVNKAVTAANVSIGGGNPECVSVTFVNTGANPAYLWLDNTVSAANGILLAANGGFLSLTVRDDMTLPTRDWHAVAPSGNTTIAAIYALRSIAVERAP